MRHIWRRSFILLLALLLSLSFLGSFAPKHSGSQPTLEPVTSHHYLEVPGITEEEIAAIGELRERFDYFSYGIPLSTEAFVTQDGEIAGFSALLCDWLTNFFDIEFRPEIIEFAHLIEALDSGEMDFGGGLAPTEERKAIYHMTDPITNRTLKFYVDKREPSFREIQRSRKLRFVFLEGSATTQLALEHLDPEIFDAYFVKTNQEAVEKLVSGEVDAFVHQNTSEILFEGIDYIVSENFFPNVFVPVTFVAQRDELDPIITVLQKELNRKDALKHLTQLYNEGEDQYHLDLFNMRLTDEERGYLSTNPVLHMAVEKSNYPIAFFNIHEKEYQGITIDVLERVSEITGIAFEVIADGECERALVLQLLDSEEIEMSSIIPRSLDKEGQFAWSETVITDEIVLISKRDFHHIHSNEINYLSIGLQEGSINEDIFDIIFPYAKENEYQVVAKKVPFEDREALLQALINDEIDVVLSNKMKVLHLTHYKELPDFKVNLNFGGQVEYAFAFQQEDKMLRDIVNKALVFVDTEEITEQWVGRTFDYRVKVSEARAPLITGIMILVGFVLLLIIVLFIRIAIENKKLYRFQDSLITIMADTIASRDVGTGKHILNTTTYLGILINKCTEMGVYQDEILKLDRDKFLLSSELHDVGKISVEDAILRKPARLSDEEYNQIKTHAKKGAEIIDLMKERTKSTVTTRNFLEHAKQFAYSHHERWDGSGYPHGLKGEEIPLEGRLLAIADVYDALVAERPYKKSFSNERAAEIIIEGSGTQFDPKLIAVFKEAKDEFAKALRKDD